MATLTSQPAVPSKIVAGDTLEFEVTIDDFPSDEGWTLTYYFFNAAQSFKFQAVADGAGGYSVIVAGAITALWVAGDYSFEGKVASVTAEQHTVDAGSAVQVLADVTAGLPVDSRSFAKKALDAIEAKIIERASQALTSYTLGDRQINKKTDEELIVTRDRFKKIVLHEENAERMCKGLDSRTKIRARFSNTIPIRDPFRTR